MGTLIEVREMPNGGHVSLWEYTRYVAGTDGENPHLEFDRYVVEIAPIGRNAPSFWFRLELPTAQQLANALNLIVGAAMAAAARETEVNDAEIREG